MSYPIPLNIPPGSNTDDVYAAISRSFNSLQSFVPVFSYSYSATSLYSGSRTVTGTSTQVDTTIAHNLNIIPLIMVTGTAIQTYANPDNDNGGFPGPYTDYLSLVVTATGQFNSTNIYNISTINGTAPRFKIFLNDLNTLTLSTWNNDKGYTTAWNLTINLLKLT